MIVEVFEVCAPDAGSTPAVSTKSFLKKCAGLIQKKLKI